MIPATSHTLSSNSGDPTCAAITPGLRKIPEPITPPATSIVALNRPSAGISFGCSGLVVGSEATAFIGFGRRGAYKPQPGNKGFWILALQFFRNPEGWYVFSVRTCRVADLPAQPSGLRVGVWLTTSAPGEFCNAKHVRGLRHGIGEPGFSRSRLVFSPHCCAAPQRPDLAPFSSRF